jgi:hypothetical protein
LLNQPIHLSAISPVPVTAICLAALYGFEKVVVALVDGGADVNVCDIHGRTPLMLACAQGMVEAVQALIGAGADVNAKDNAGHRVLQYSCVAVKPSELRAALHVNRSSGSCSTEPPNQALLSLEGYPVCFEQLLLRAAADPTIECPKRKSSPLHWAAGGTCVPICLTTGDDDVVVNLVYRPASFEGRCDLVTMLAQAGAELDAADERGMTALHVSVSQQSNLSVAMRLLDLRAEPNLTDANGVLPLQSLLKAHLATDPATEIMQQALIDCGVGKPVRHARYDAERFGVEDGQRYLYDSEAAIRLTFQQFVKPQALEAPRATRAFLLSLC